ncbi:MULTISPECIES: LysR family transcriptional regulator [Acinetobacter]|uniref:LysR family transcriptional regulator n=1 Tax=Acinetobacter TaxID=469 RepID=UPI0006611A35|nr:MULTISPECIES: LysR family transcriptional regulator [Acinetobacter]KOR16310.1 LuxR family transcriptional regulator [Acinetobacter sp. C15]MBO3671710.1 LysR family transcriptional regulator [Acinetobacter soli]RSB53936.1 LysR family transcriptional regulator [Acinetobacter soli]
MFDPRLLRAFVAIVETGSFTLAADQLHMTQSTISQQLARLEHAVGKPLIERQSRSLQLTTAGESLLGYARRILALQLEAQNVLSTTTGSIPIRIGVPEDIMNTEMARLLHGFSEAHRSIRLDVTAGLSRDLMTRYRAGQFDIVIVKEPMASADHFATFPEAIAWFESQHFSQVWPDPIPLVTFPQGGLYRDEMFDFIERERKHWYVAFSSNSLASVLVGIEAGLGISLLPVAATQGYNVREYSVFGRAPAMAVSLYRWEKDGVISELATQMAQILQNRLHQFAPSTSISAE